MVVRKATKINLADLLHDELIDAALDAAEPRIVAECYHESGEDVCGFYAIDCCGRTDLHRHPARLTARQTVGHRLAGHDVRPIEPRKGE